MYVLQYAYLFCNLISTLSTTENTKSIFEINDDNKVLPRPIGYRLNLNSDQSDASSRRQLKTCLYHLVSSKLLSPANPTTVFCLLHRYSHNLYQKLPIVYPKIVTSTRNSSIRVTRALKRKVFELDYHSNVAKKDLEVARTVTFRSKRAILVTTHKTIQEVD